MKNETPTISIVKQILENDPTFTPETIKMAIDVLRSNGKKPTGQKMIKSKEAAEILGCSRTLLQKLAEEGKLHPKRYSQRKTRYFYDEVMSLAEGIEYTRATA